MKDREEAIRRRAYALWTRAGRPEARSEEFWYAAEREIEGEDAIDPLPVDPFEPPIDEPPAAAFQHGVPVGLPGERVAEPGVEGDRVADLLPIPNRPPDD